MDAFLNHLTLCTFSTGPTMVREVLNDWEEFLGGRPAQVIFVVGAHEGVVPPIYEELLTEGRIDQLIRLETRGRKPEAMNAVAVDTAVRAAATEWVLVTKLDTLPYRVGHDGWLSAAIQVVEAGQYAGLTATTPFERDLRRIDGYRIYQKFSENFAITRQSDWLAAVGSVVGSGDYEATFAQHPRFQADDNRYVNEVVFEDWLRAQGRYILARDESPTWSIFHVNVWGDRLRQVRELYRSRQGIAPFLNIQFRRGRHFFYPWEIYYGTPPPPLINRLRMTLGFWRRKLIRR